MNVLIAKTREECAYWTGISVVIDVLCGSTTACALVEKKQQEILTFPDLKSVEKFVRGHSEFEVFSEWDLPVSFQHDSPYLAGKSSAKTPAVLIDGATLAVFASTKASRIYLGGFCNFFKLAKEISYQGQDVLIIPASLFTSQEDVEDVLCAESLKDYLQGVGLPETAVGEMGNTVRLSEYIERGPKTASKDASFAFKINRLDIVPQVTLSVHHTFGVIHQAGIPLPEGGIIQVLQNAEAKVDTYTPGEATQLVAEESLVQLREELLASLPERLAKNAALGKEGNTLREGEISARSQTVEFYEKRISAQPIEETKEPKKETTSKIKGFFSNFIRAVKEEKEEVEQAFFRKSQQMAKPVEKTADSSDLLDNILSKKEESSSHGTITQQKASLADTPKPEGAAVPVKSPETEIAKAEVMTESVSLGGKKKKKAIVLFSGGLDSTTCLYWALNQGYECEALTVSYGQRHDREVLAAQLIARNLGVKHHMITLNLPWLATSSLVDKNQSIPDVAVEDIPNAGVPTTYVPGRNLMFLSIAGSLLDSVGATAIVAGPNAIDFSGYPDCTPAFFKAAADALNRGTVSGVNEGIEVLAPLMRLSKAEIVKLASQLKVPFEQTWSCYAGGQKPCGNCDSCKLRAKGFEEAGVHDTALD